MTLSTIPLNLNELFNVIVDAIIAFDREQRILYFNRGAEMIFGYSAEEALGLRLDALLPAQFAQHAPAAFR